MIVDLRASRPLIKHQLDHLIVRLHLPLLAERDKYFRYRFFFVYYEIFLRLNLMLNYSNKLKDILF